MLFQPPTGCLERSPGCQEVQNKKERRKKRVKSEVTGLYYHVEEVELAGPAARQNEQLSKFIHFNSAQYLQVKFLLCEEPEIFSVSFLKQEPFGAAGAELKNNLCLARLKCQTNN